MKEIITNLVENESENTRLDFKSEQYPIEKGDSKKGEFLKDLCAFSNLLSKEDKFIIIGVIEKNGVASGFKPIAKLHDQASYQQFLNQYIEPEINFEYREVIYQEKRLAYFRLFDNNKGPYLFKKEYTDNQLKGNQYRVGTGFIRIGTSTRELRRDDFEKIYSNRLAIKDRSEEINFKVTLGGLESSKFKSTIYRHLQVDIINKSNASIDLDIQAKIYNNKGVIACYTQDIERKISKEKRDNNRLDYTQYSDKVLPPHLFINMNVDFECYDTYSVYEITPKTGTQTALRIKQKGIETDIFNGQILLVFSKPAEVNVELIVRSNDFIKGPKTFTYNFSKNDTEQLLDPWDL
jgi:hypothetical protein